MTPGPKWLRFASFCFMVRLWLPKILLGQGMHFTEIDNLTRLLSAESEQVRGMVLKELHERRDQMEDYLAQSPELEPDILFQLHEMAREYKLEKMRSEWLAWTSLGSEFLKLEAALDFLARKQDADNTYPPLSQLLDELVAKFLKQADETSVDALNQFLFVSSRFKAAREDFFNPVHSNLCHVIQHRQGLPISLSCLMILTGYRLGLDITGFNLPGHFLARANVGGQMVLVDCFNGGKYLSEGEIAALSLSPKVNFQELVSEPPTAADIITRVLVNLINAHHRNGNLTRHFATQDLLADLKHHLAGNTQVQTIERGPSLFQCGQLVRHKNYGYRGVIVDFDLTCQADEKWYRSNRTQPEKDQPWYHVLVDGSSVTTYAAQANLEEDPSHTEVRHPLIPLYFQGFHKGSYRRNNVPWSL